MKILTIVLLLILVSSLKAELPPVILDASNPGSKIYAYDFKNELLKCEGRDVDVFIPVSKVQANKNYPVVIYGHGQALGVDNYRLTLEHLAKKGILAIFPTYDKGFFDRDWRRMGRDYVNLSDCALSKLKQKYGLLINNDQILFSGHSKGAYVASVAAGMAFRESLNIKPKSILLFESAGVDLELNAAIDPSVALTVVYSDKDTIVSKKISDDMYKSTPSSKKQFIYLKSYPELAANHFWPLTKSSVVGGGPESVFHYYASWKWLVAGANDLQNGGTGSNPYLYGEFAGDKGIGGFKDDITRNY